jgi:heme/copper-type cytochrome/quinol oxidase subunit 4
MPLAESIEDYRDSQHDMHRWMIPIVGFIFLLILSVIAGSLATRGTRSFRFLKYILLLHVLIQMLFAVLLLATAEWEWAAQLGLTAIFGLFAGITLGVDYLGVYSVICLFNLLCLMGRMSFLGYEHSLYDLYDRHPNHCHEWFGLSHHHASSLCYGYVSFSRVLAYLMVWLVAAQSFVSYYIYKERSLEYGSVTGSATTKTREAYGTIGSEDYGTIGSQS